MFGLMMTAKSRSDVMACSQPIGDAGHQSDIFGHQGMSRSEATMHSAQKVAQSSFAESLRLGNLSLTLAHFPTAARRHSSVTLEVMAALSDVSGKTCSALAMAFDSGPGALNSILRVAEHRI